MKTANSQLLSRSKLTDHKSKDKYSKNIERTLIKRMTSV